MVKQISFTKMEKKKKKNISRIKPAGFTISKGRGELSKFLFLIDFFKQRFNQYNVTIIPVTVAVI